MKKVIKNYLAKLQENDKKGFSLVELIIVMAIMAILVGIYLMIPTLSIILYRVLRKRGY